jgi:DivIVA domain-containing protein
VNDTVVAQLRQIIARYGVEVCEDPRRVENLLRDLSGQSRREIAVLSGAAREGVPAGLLTSRDGAPPAVLGERLVRLLQDNLGMADEAARWAVSAWAAALGVAVDVSMPVGVDRSQAFTMQPVGSEAQASTRERASRLLDQAEDAARSVTNELDKVTALARVADGLVALDPRRAARLFDDAERIAQADPLEFESAMVNLANVLAVTDPDRALRIACSLAERFAVSKAMVVTKVTEAVAVTNPDRAEQLAQSISLPDYKARALVTVAVAVTAADPTRATRLSNEAERAARSMPEEITGAKALARVAAVLGAADPSCASRLVSQAERIARFLSSDFHKSSVITEVAKALAIFDTDRALELAGSIRDKSERNQVILRAAEALSFTNPDRALQIAYSITVDQPKIEAVCRVAKVLAATDPDRAGRLLADAERMAAAIRYEYHRAIALADIANAWQDAARPRARPLPVQMPTSPVADLTAPPAPVDVASSPVRVRKGEERIAESLLASGPGAAETAGWVKTKQFSTTRLRPGYDEEEVDAFLDEICDTFLGKRTPPLRPDDVRHKQFSTTRLRPGYDEEEVDAFLDEVESRLAAWLERSAGTTRSPPGHVQWGWRGHEP